MKHVVFVVPYLGQTTFRFFKPMLEIPDVGVSVVTHEPVERFPQEYRDKMVGHYRVNNTLDAGQVVVACRFLMQQNGPIHRLIGFLEDLQITLGTVRDHLGIYGMSEAVARNFREKARMKDILRSNGLPCARHLLATNTEQVRQFRQQVGFPIVIKPPAGAGARNTFQINDDQQLNDYLSVAKLSPEDPTLFEEFIKGQEYSFEGVSIDGKLVWFSSTRYYPTPLEVLKNPWIQWCVLLPRELDAPHYQQITEANKHALKALGMQTGLTHMEWFLRDDGSIAISEVAARPPGAQIMTLTALGYDFDFHKSWVELMILGTFPFPQQKYAAGAAFLRGMGKGRVKAVHGIEQAQREVGSLVIEAKLPQVGQHSSTSYEGEGYVVVRHTDTEVVKEALQRLINTIRVEFED